MIKLQIIGHLGKDATIQNVNGKDVINFNACHTESYKDAQGVKHEKSTWVSCSYWAERTAVAAYLKKGTLVYVEGTPSVRVYQNQQGQSNASLELRVFSVQLLSSNQNKESNTNGQQQQSQNSTRAYTPPPPPPPISEDDLPF